MRRANQQKRSPTSLIAQELRTMYVPQIGLTFEMKVLLEAIDLLAPAAPPMLLKESSRNALSPAVA